MVPSKLIHARGNAQDLVNAIQAQITMHSYGVQANFVAANGALEDAETALGELAQLLGFRLVAREAVREGSDQLVGVAAE